MSGRREWNDPEYPSFATARDLACRSVDPEWFFPRTNGMYADRHIRRAKRICRPCPQIAACLKWALDTGQDHGIWGGTTPAERREISERTAA